MRRPCYNRRGWEGRSLSVPTRSVRRVSGFVLTALPESGYSIPTATQSPIFRLAFLPNPSDESSGADEPRERN